MTTPATSHSITISNLAPSVLYHFRVKCHDSTGTLVVSGDFTFTTSPPITVTVTPATTSLSAGQSKRLAAAVSGTTNIAVTWTMIPAVGTLTSDGTYTAPASIATTQNVTVAATSVVDPTKSGSAIVSLVPGSSTLIISMVQASSITSSSAVIKWTTNLKGDGQVEFGTTAAYGLTSPLNTTAATSHSINISNLTASTVYHFRVKSHGPSGALTTSGDFTFKTLSSSPYTLAASPSNVTAATTLTVTWTSPTASGWGDWIGLFPVGAPTNQNTLLWGCFTNYPSDCSGTDGQINQNKTSGTLIISAVQLATGVYEFRYMRNQSYTPVQSSNPVTVH